MVATLHRLRCKLAVSAAQASNGSIDPVSEAFDIVDTPPATDDGFEVEGSGNLT